MHAALVVTLLAAIDISSANRAFSELEALCAADAGRMWGQSLCGRVVFVDPHTREAVTREGPAKIPDSIGIANTSIEWNGENWTMVMWPLPEKLIARRVLLAHESFHRLQKELGLPMSNPQITHLDSAAGRSWMRLEWRALARALVTRDRRDVAAALAFRVAHHLEEEQLLEMNEGLAEYTGYALTIPRIRERIAPLVVKLAKAEKGESFSRSFAYTSGPAWGTLIEMKDRKWTRKLKAGDDLGEIAARLWKVRAILPQAGRFREGPLWLEEKAREEKKYAMLEALQRKFFFDPVLRIPLTRMQFTFDPNDVQPLGYGNVYRSMEVRDVWGKLTVTGGGFISADYSHLVVPASGEGYELTLNEGWKIIAGGREGDKTVGQ